VPSLRPIAVCTFGIILTVILGFIFGATSYPRAMDLLATVQLSFQQVTSKRTTGNWYPACFEHSGVRRYDAARTQPGYTLCTLAPVRFTDGERRAIAEETAAAALRFGYNSNDGAEARHRR
jgi:hypothetical protein